MVLKNIPSDNRPGGGYTAREIEQFRRESLLADAYQNKLPGIRLFHQQRIKSILSLLEQARASLPPGERLNLVEIGCGDGFLLEQIERRFPALDLHALDISLTALQRSRRRAPAAKLTQSAADQISFRGEAFDLALCSEVIEHVADDRGLLQDIFRILKPGGGLVLTTPNLHTLRNIIKKIRGKGPLIEIPEHLREYTFTDLRTKIIGGGFQITRFHSVGFYLPKMHWFFRSKILSGLIFTLARIFPRQGRDFMLIAFKPLNPSIKKIEPDPDSPQRS